MVQTPILRNAALNFTGQAVPLLVAIAAIPPLIAGLGTDRFGFLTIAWVLIGYFGLFDLGVGWAVTKLVAERLGSGLEHELPPLLWTALWLLSALGTVAAAVALFLSRWLVSSVFSVPAVLQDEALSAFRLLALSLPIVTGTTALRGILDGKGRFDLGTFIRVPMGILLLAGPLVVLPFSRSLVWIVAILIVARAGGWVAYFLAVLRIVPSLRQPVVPQWFSVPPMLRFGGWITITNIISPMMVYLDRLLVAALVSLTAVAYYATPYEIVTKLWVVPQAFVGVLFPAFAHDRAARNDRNSTDKIFSKGALLVLITILPVTLGIVAFAPEALTLWLGADFAAHGTAVLRWLAAGVLVNSLAQLAFTMILGFGRSDLTAKIHMLELPVYLAVAWFLISRHGITGCAIAWFGRVLLDAMLMFLAAAKVVPSMKQRISRLGVVVACALACCLVVTVPGSALSRVMLLLVLVPFAIVGIRLGLAQPSSSLLKVISGGLS